MIGGLVEHQHVGCRQQQTGEGHPHAPATGQLVHRPSGVVGGETQPGQHPVGLGFERVAAELLETTLEGAVAVDDVGVVGGVDIAETGLEFLELLVDLDDVVRARHDFVDDEPIGCGFEILREIADALVLGHVHLARIGLLDAEQDLDERRLAGSVPADERHSTPVGEPQRDVAEQHPTSVGFRQS